MTRIRTKIGGERAEREHERGSPGTDGGSSKPSSRRTTSASTARPMKKTSLPSTPLCQPITASFTPTPEPAYQSMNEESMSTSPATQVMRSPAAQRPPAAAARA